MRPVIVHSGQTPNMTSIADFASKFINNTNKHIFLTGKAGSGKTTFLKTTYVKTEATMISKNLENNSF